MGWIPQNDLLGKIYQPLLVFITMLESWAGFRRMIYHVTIMLSITTALPLVTMLQSQTAWIPQNDLLDKMYRPPFVTILQSWTGYRIIIY